MRKTITSIAIIIILGIALAFLGKSRSEGETENSVSKTPEIEVAKVSDLAKTTEIIQFPAVVFGDQEAQITAKSAGTVSAVNFDLGNRVSAGQEIVRIEDAGNSLGLGENNLKSAQIEQLELAVREAKKSYDLAKRNYEKDSTKALKISKDIAKLQYESAVVALQGALDSHRAVSPIAGVVVEKSVSVGDSVSVGQLLGVVSQTGRMKIRFFVDEGNLPAMKSGNLVKVKTGDGGVFEARISNISPRADATTKKFAIEALPETQANIFSGTLVSVEVEKEIAVKNSGDVIVSLPTVIVSQGENYIFVLSSGSAKKVPVEIKEITGEKAEISGNFGASDQIIVSGNRNLTDGQAVNTK